MSKMPGTSKRIRIFSDFDGTITSHDSIVFLTESFGRGPEYRSEILAEIKSGQLTVYEAVRRELATVTIPWEKARAELLSKIEVDAGFAPFVEWCKEAEIELMVLSSGIWPVLELFLGPLKVPFAAHPIDFSPSGWRYRRDPKLGKVPIIQQGGEDHYTIYIGDGASDIEVIGHVDLLFAKNYLADFCRENRQPFRPFSDFEGVLKEMKLKVGPNPEQEPA